MSGHLSARSLPTSLPGIIYIYHYNSHIATCRVVMILPPSLPPSFLNALAYGWTGGDFLSVMSRRRLRRHSRQPPDSLGTSYNAMMEEGEEDDMLQETENEEELKRNQLHLLQEKITHKRGTARENKFSHDPYLPERVSWRLTLLCYLYFVHAYYFCICFRLL